MLDTLNQWDTQLFRWINSHHCDVADTLLWTCSQHWFWAVVLALAFCFGPLRREPRRCWVVVIGVVLCFLLADRGSVLLFKEQFHRLRPCMALDDVRMFRTHCGKPYGFVSSHAANAFAIVSFLWLRYRRWAGHSRGRALVLPVLLLAWVLATCYSRVYLGKHYPGDILGGALFGIACGAAVWAAIRWAENFFEKKWHKSVTKK